MFYITGDTHGEFSRIERFCNDMSPSPDDTLIILGDAGINFHGRLSDVIKKEQLAQLPLTVFSIHGNHEMRPGTIASYHATEWCGGQVYVEDAFPNLLFAVDGEVYDLGGPEALVVGGAYSIDKYYRLSHGWGWWPDEQPSPAIKEKVERVLEERNWAVDVVLSHITPLRYEPVECFLPGIDQSKVDKSTETWLGMKIVEAIRQEVMRLNEAQQREILAFARALRQKDESGVGVADLSENGENDEGPTD